MWMLECCKFFGDTEIHEDFFVFFEHCEDALEVAKKGVRYKANWEELGKPDEIYLYYLDTSTINGFNRMTFNENNEEHYAFWGGIREEFMKQYTKYLFFTSGQII